MSKKKYGKEQALSYQVQTRVCKRTYTRLKAMINNSPNRDISGLVRDILDNKPITLLTYDRSLDMVMLELNAIRSEINSIGVNINQITRAFNSYSETKSREFYAKTAFNKYEKLQPVIENLFETVEKIKNKWLQESGLEKQLKVH